jgi:hypothetical protein
MVSAAAAILVVLVVPVVPVVGLGVLVVVVLVLVLVLVLVHNFAVRLLFTRGSKYNIDILGSYSRFVNDMALDH